LSPLSIPGVCDYGCPTDARRSTNVSYVPSALGAGARRLPWLGRNLSIHPATTVSALFDEEIRGYAAVPQGYESGASSASGCGAAPRSWRASTSRRARARCTQRCTGT
jgi:hypothetical protein